VGSAFESRLVRALALVASGVLHAALLIAVFATDLPPAQVEIPIEMIELPARAPDDGAPRDGDDEPAQDVTALPAPPTADDLPGGERPRHYREILRERERAFEAAMQARAQRLAALDGWRASSSRARREVPEVRACGAHDRGALVATEREREMERYSGFVPTGLFPSRYTAGMTQVVARKRAGLKRLGMLEFALPPRTTPVQLDDPAGTLFALGRDDARCLIGMSWDDEAVFPIRFTRVPARYVDGADKVYEVRLDVDVFVDGTFALTNVEGDALPLSGGALFDQKTVARNLAQHAVGAQVVRGLVETLFD
jgi:hypothetical protein